MEDLLADARGSELEVDEEAAERTGGSVYLPTTGWTGEYFAGVVTLQASESPQGWSFSGLGLHTSEEVIEANIDLSAWWEGFVDRLETNWSPPPYGIGPPFPSPTPTPTPSPTPTPKRSPKRTRGKVATMDISAPWSTGEHCTAGGIINWRTPKPAPGAGSCVAGPAGFYYKTGPTHSDFEDKHAIDFTQYRKSDKIYKFSENSAFGTPVLATNYGQVKHVYFGTRNGNKGTANKVILDHMNGQLPGSGVYTDFRSRYLHLNNSIVSGVSPGNFVNQGDKLSEMDDTGNSAFHHLHFNVRKVYNDESVQPTPMDGQSLKQNVSDNGSCIQSR